MLMCVLGKDLLDWIGLGTGPDTDPYLAKTNEACLGGDLAECFKSRALGSLDEFFSKVSEPQRQLIKKENETNRSVSNTKL